MRLISEYFISAQAHSRIVNSSVQYNMSRNYFFVLLLVANVNEIRGNPITTDTVTCNDVGANICEVPVYDPDLPMVSDHFPAENIMEVRLNGSVKSMKLTSNVCNAFPNLLIIKAMGIGLKEVAADAFKNCSKLTAIYLDNNEISSLDNSIFETNPQLERLEVQNNTIKTFNTSILNHTPKLQLMFLSDNGMEDFILSDVSTQLTQLRKIDLQNNKLKSLDLGEVEKKFPNIRVLVMCNRDVVDVKIVMPDVPERHFLSLNDFDSCE